MTTSTTFPWRPGELGELAQQATVVSALRNAGHVFAAIPNGHVRSKRQHLQARQEGVSAGMPDLLIFDPPPNLPSAVGVALEMKRKSGRSRDVRKNQRSWLRDLADRGWVPVVGYGALDALCQLMALGYMSDLSLNDAQVPHPRKLERLCRLISQDAAPQEFLSGSQSEDADVD